MSWLETTRENIQKLFKEGYFDDWKVIEFDPITFYLHPQTVVAEEWFKKRSDTYSENSKRLKITEPPKVSFYVYPSLEFGKTIGITPATSFVSTRQIHGHPNQSPGHELTHILLGEINSTDNLPANGLWAEGVCVYLDGTETDRHKHAGSLNYPEETISTDWTIWRQNLPGNLYPLAGSIIQYLDTGMGWDRILSFLKELKNSGSNDAELSETLFNKNYSQLQKDWRDWLK